MSECLEVSGRDIGLTAIRGRMVSVKELAGFLRVSERWVEKHMKSGTFPFGWFPIGERIRVADSADINDWLKEIKVSASTALLPKKAIEKIQKEEVSA